MWDYLKNPDTWMSMIAIVLSIIALFQTSRQVKLSNKQQLFDRRLSRYLEFHMIHSLYTQNKLYLKDEFARNEQGHLVRYYRLNAVKNHTQEMALAYGINCPNCGSRLKQIGRQLSFNELGLYSCPCCNRNK